MAGKEVCKEVRAPTNSDLNSEWRLVEIKVSVWLSNRERNIYAEDITYHFATEDHKSLYASAEKVPAEWREKIAEIEKEIKKRLQGIEKTIWG